MHLPITILLCLKSNILIKNIEVVTSIVITLQCHDQHELDKKRQPVFNNCICQYIVQKAKDSLLI